MTDPKAAPPETDLRAMDNSELLDCLVGNAVLYYDTTDDAIRDDCVRFRRASRAELERRLARPEALRERIDRVIDDVFGPNWSADPFTLKAAVAAVLEEISNA